MLHPRVYDVFLVLVLAALMVVFVQQRAKGASGIASVYNQSSGPTASGRRGAMTAAHRYLPFGSKVRVTNKRTGRSVVVTIVDRGPFVRGRIIDLTRAAGRAIGLGYSIAPVNVQRIN